MNKYDVVQFNENHKWCGNLGIIYEVKEINNDIRYKIGVATPKQKIKYIYVFGSDYSIERIGEAFLYVREK